MASEPSATTDQPGLAERRVVRHGVRNDREVTDQAKCDPDLDTVAVEEPLEIRINGQTLAVTMRTPGNDATLALGFLFSEGIVHAASDIELRGDPETRSLFEGENIVDVCLRPSLTDTLGEITPSCRGTLTTSACGVCGRKTIGDLIERCGMLSAGPTLSSSLVSTCMARLRGMQLNFARTGGVHAAAAFAADGTLLAAHEDVGRHNATDKVIGSLLNQRLVGTDAAWKGHPRRPILLVVSGRASFELVQKAIAAGIPCLASVSAASSLAIDLAVACGLTLVAFARGTSCNVYSHPERISATGA